jgi:hypothetical protein
MKRRELLLAAAGLSVLSRPGAAAPAPASKPKGLRPSGFVLMDRNGTPDGEARDYLGTPRSEAAAKKGLDYLAGHQNPGGSWGETQFTTDVGISGLCLMAFQSAGHQPDRGPHGKLLRTGVDYLKRNCQPSGLIHDPKRTFNRPMYSHGFGTLALAELYGMTRRTDLRDPLEKAVELILNTQNPAGGWRYYPRIEDADISVVICQIMALRAADNAGIPVPKETVSKAIGYVKRCANNADGGFSYMPEMSGSGEARSAAGVLSLIVMGEREAPEVKRGLEYLLAHPAGSARSWRFYGLYYGTQATYQAGGKHWQAWYPRLIRFLQDNQRPDGNWYDDPGYAYATAMGVLALNVPGALLPVYQK